MVDYGNIAVLIVENKTVAKSASSWLHIIGQAQRYARNNNDVTSVFLMLKALE